MRNYIAVVFSDKHKAYEGLHGLWQLDTSGEITIHGTAVVHCDKFGQFHVDTKDTHPALATAIGVGVGALLGLFAGPAGVAIGAVAGAGLGAAAGGVVGGVTDLARADTRSQAMAETRLLLGRGQSAVIADITEESISPVDSRMRELKGAVFRRAKSDVREDSAWFNDSYPFYPYEYVPARDALYW